MESFKYQNGQVGKIEAAFISAVIGESLLAYRVPVMKQSEMHEDYDPRADRLFFCAARSNAGNWNASKQKFFKL
ncbi:hypothetical protein [Paenibacillus sp. NPDC055715]